LKKILIASLVVFSMFFVACGGGGSSGPAGPTYMAPDMGAATDLADTSSLGGAVTAPATSAEALTLYQGASNAVGNAMLGATARSARSAKGTTSQDYPISWSGAVGGGSVDVTGNIHYSATTPDTQPTTAGTFKNYMTMGETVDISGTITSVTVQGTSPDTHSYTVSGKVNENMVLNMAINLFLAQTGSTATMDLGLGIAVGTAYSVRRDDGVGAKFIITYGGTVSKSGMSLDNFNIAAFETSLTSELMGKTVTLHVYNDSNVEIYSASMTLNDLCGQQFSSFM
jgi:hypothetical protein